MELELLNTVITLSGVSNVDWVMNKEESGYPAITLNLISEVAQRTMSGIQPVQESLIQIDVWHTDFEEALIIKNAIRMGLDCHSGEIINAAFLKRIRHNSETIDDNLLYRFSMDFSIQYNLI